MPVKSKRKHTIPMTNADCAVCDATNSSAEDTPSPRLTRMLLGTVENRISNARKWPIVVKKRIATRYSLIIFVNAGFACNSPMSKTPSILVSTILCDLRSNEGNKFKKSKLH
jgi:hypothetical protein